MSRYPIGVSAVTSTFATLPAIEQGESDLMPAGHRAAGRAARAAASKLALALSLALAPGWAASAGVGTGAAPALPAPVAPPLTTEPRATAVPETRPLYSLERLLELARTQSTLLAIGRSDELAARASVTTARAYPNPELELGLGRASGQAGGSAPLLGVAQPLEMPWLRSSRLQSAQARVEVAASQTALTQTVLVAEIKRRFLEAARLREEVDAFRDDLRLVEQIRDRVRVRVRTGEAPRFDLIRAETEVAVAVKNVESALARLRQALGSIRLAVGPQLEPDFDVLIEAADVALPGQEQYRLLRERLLLQNPEVALAQREFERAQRQIELERALAQPQVSLLASQERDPSLTINRIGARISVPLLNRREGPIAEAQALAERARLQLEQRRFEALSGFEAAWQAYDASTALVRALETGIVDRSRAVIDVAEAAYRYGERGILEFLDAQRQFRLVRNELIQARTAARLARVELERLAGVR